MSDRTPPQPRDPDFAARVRASFARQRVMDTIGAELADVAPGTVELRMPIRSDLTQQHGFLHAGIVATLLDSACGYAAFTLMSADAAVLSIEFKVNLLAPARGTHLRARADVLRAGRTITVCSANAWATTEDGTESIVATMLATIMAIHDRPGVAG